MTKSYRSQCPVVEAARFGHLDVLRFLVKVAGFNVNATGEGGETAVMAATSSGNWDCARWLNRDKRISAEERRAAALAALNDSEQYTADQAALFAESVAFPGGESLPGERLNRAPSAF